MAERINVCRFTDDKRDESEKIVQQPADSEGIETRLKTYSEAALSLNTRQAYWADFGRFTMWANENGVDNIPASPETLCRWIDHLVSEKKRITTIRRSVAVIRAAHRLEDRPDPCTKLVKHVLLGVARTIGSPTRQAEPLTLPKLRQVISIIPNDLRGVRNRALVLLGWFAALRRSELVAVRLEDLEHCHEGIILTVRRSKTDQEGRGRRIAIPVVDDSDLNAVAAVNEWIISSDIKTGFLFRSIGKSDAETPTQGNFFEKTKPRALTPRSVALIVQRLAKLAGLPWQKYSGHSLRSGFATTCAAAAVPTIDIQKVTGHKTAAQLAVYVREGNIWTNCPAVQLLGRKA